MSRAQILSRVLSVLPERVRAHLLKAIRRVALLDFDPNIDAGLVRARQLQEVVALTPWMMLANLANATILFGFLWKGSESWALALWSACIAFISGRTLYTWMRRRHQPPPSRVSSRTIIRATRHAGLLGLLWGLLPLFVLPQGGVGEQVLTTNVIAGMSAGGAFALAAIPAAAAAYLGLMLGPALVAIGIGYIPASTPLFALGIIYFLTLAFTIVARYREFSKRISYQFRVQQQSETISLLLKDFEQSASDWLWETDRDGNLTYVSDRLVQLTGLAKADLLGQPISHSAGAASCDNAWSELMDRMREGRAARDWVVPAQLANGPAWWSMTAGPVAESEGLASAYRGVGTDITERVKAQHALAEKNAKLAAFNARLELEVAERTREAQKAAAEAQEASRAKSVFLASMSHEIRTPMNGVLGMTDLLSRSDLTSHQQRLVNTINQSGLTLLSIINDILDHSRIEAGKLDLDPQPFDLRACVEGAIEILSEEAHRKSLEVSLLMPPKLPNRFVGDGGRLRQVLVNLIGNAVKFTHEGGVSVRVASAGATDGKMMLSFSVSDTGIGIAPEAQALLFNPFAQADSSISRRFGGTGLGLSISQSLVRMMGGDMTLKSAPGEGTTVFFDVALPVAEAPSALDTGELPEVMGLRVLVVDDRPANREVVTFYLSEAGAQADCAGCGEDALQMLQSAHREGEGFDLVIVDMMMPGMNGLQLAQRIRTSRELTGTRIMLLTSLSWKGDRQTARAHGVSEFLSKPVRHRDLIETVRRCMSAAAPDVVDLQGGAAPQCGRHGKFEGLKVLLAEDNAVNQLVMSEYAEILGCEMSVAENGLDAVAQFDGGSFDVVLMDCQMPELDGFGACRRIRELEQEGGMTRTPVIAVTANAYESDRTACIDAGMDDVVTKPCSLDEFAAKLEQWALRGDVAQKITLGGSDPVDVEPLLDVSVLQSLEETSAGVADRLSELYLSTAPKLVRQILMGLTDKDHASVGAAAHSLKSASATIGAMHMAGMARRIETEARARSSISQILLTAAFLEGELARLEAAMVQAPWRGIAQSA